MICGRPISILLVLAAQIAVVPAQPVLERLRADVEFLSAPALGGRVSLDRGAEVAAQFIAAEYRKAGLRPANGSSYFQDFRLAPIHLVPGKTRLGIRRQGSEQNVNPVSVFLGDPSRPVRLEAPMVFAGFGITAPELGYDDYAGIDVQGKVVLLFDHEPQESDPKSIFNGTGFTLYAGAWYKTWNAQRHGALAVILATEPVNRHRPPHREPDRANAPAQALVDGELRIPRFTIPTESLSEFFSETGKSPSEWQSEIDRTLRPVSRELTGVRVLLEAENQGDVSALAQNVVGWIEGSDPALKAETVVLGAHYDHLGIHNGRVYPGANDNASGIAALLEVARRFQEAQIRPGRSILFLAFGAEEESMLGSFFYVAHPLRPLATTRAVLNLDMIGRHEEHIDESRGAYEVSDDTSNEINLVAASFSPALAALVARENRSVGMRLNDKFDRESSMRTLFRCDHLPFLYKNVPALWLFGGFHPGYHTPADTADKIDYPKLKKVTRLAYLSALAVAR